MGKLMYGNAGVVISFDDRVLAHLQVVISAKLRRNEAFFFSWKEDVNAGSGRGSVWIEKSIPLRFIFATSKFGPMNRSWIDELNLVANSTGGLVLLEEPEVDEEPTVATSSATSSIRPNKASTRRPHSTVETPRRDPAVAGRRP